MQVLFNFEVHTPYRFFYSGMTQAITLTLVDGEIGVYANHSSFTAPVVECILRIKDAEDIWRAAFVSRGILEVKKEKTVLIVDSAEWPEEIDMQRAFESKQQAEKDLEDSHLKFETDRAKEQLRRADLRLKVLSLQ
jgi:F-type H+-transporting ATPase subunit epsilon